jgi:hypothetical protein
MKQFKDLEFVTHPIGEGFQAIIEFENGYGASIIQTPFSYGGRSGLYELAVLDETGQLTYDTPITSDVLGHLTKAEVSDAMAEIQRLPKK